MGRLNFIIAFEITSASERSFFYFKAHRLGNRLISNLNKIYWNLTTKIQQQNDRSLCLRSLVDTPGFEDFLPPIVNCVSCRRFCMSSELLSVFDLNFLWLAMHSIPNDGPDFLLNGIIHFPKKFFLKISQF